MKNINIFLVLLFSIAIISCTEDFTTPEPILEKFAIYELVEEDGLITRGEEIQNPVSGTEVRIQVLTDSDIGVVWPGDYSYKPLTGTPDSILDSRNYLLHYGLPGAQGLRMTAIEGRIGWYQDYKWPEPGTYDVTVVLTNHGIDGPEYNQKTFDFQVNVQ